MRIIEAGTQFPRLVQTLMDRPRKLTSYTFHSTMEVLCQMELHCHLSLRDAALFRTGSPFPLLQSLPLTRLPHTTLLSRRLVAPPGGLRKSRQKSLLVSRRKNRHAVPPKGRQRNNQRPLLQPPSHHVKSLLVMIPPSRAPLVNSANCKLESVSQNLLIGMEFVLLYLRYAPPMWMKCAAVMMLRIRINVWLIPYLRIYRCWASVLLRRVLHRHPWSLLRLQ